MKDWSTFLGSYHFKRYKIIEDAVEKISEDVVCKGTDPTLIFNVVAFYRHRLILKNYRVFAFHTVYLTFDVASLGVIEMR